ncbi:MAG: LPXTG cell wall anchor domain-containing protein [Proteobacteria bacterium]|nr:MAG: LPXTG cell wall anchor domain-containing protein [Pseudomonadota bacterium]
MINTQLFGILALAVVVVGGYLLFKRKNKS